MGKAPSSLRCVAAPISSGPRLSDITSAVPLSPVPANLRPRPRAVKGFRDLGYVRSMHVSRARFEELVADALDSIPPDLAAHMDNVAILVEDWPTREQLGGRPGTLLGLYEGVQLTDRSPLNYAGVMPDRVTIFRGPLCERLYDEGYGAHQIRVTIVHEIGHHFGMDDTRLRELGWA